MEKEAEQLKLNALNIRSILKGGKKKLKKITFKKRNLDRVTVARKRRRTKEKILESSKRMTRNVGAAAKNIASKVVASKPGNFLGLLLVGIAVNNVENIVKFFKGDTFEKFMNGLKSIGKFFTGTFNGFMGFFKPKNEIKIPEELNDDNAEKLNEVNKELEGIKTETDKLNEFAKSAKSQYDKFEGKIKDENQDLEKNLNVIKSKSPNSELGSSIVTGELFKDNPFGGKTFAESMNVLGGGDNVNIEPLNKEVADLNMKKKSKIKTVFVRQPIIMGEK